MDPLEPKAISLCFFSKLVLQSSVAVCPAHRALLCQCSASGGFAPGETSELAPRLPISLCLAGTIPPHLSPYLLLLGFPCPAAKFCPSPQIMGFSSLLGEHGAVPKALTGEMGFCSGMCSWELWFNGSHLGWMVGHPG